MKQLIERQQDEYDELLRGSGLDESHCCDGDMCMCGAETVRSVVWNWHKQSFKQFIDELIAWQEEEVRHPLETISHLKELKEELN